MKTTLAAVAAALAIAASPIAGAAGADGISARDPGRLADSQTSGSFEFYMIPGEWVTPQTATAVGGLTDRETMSSGAGGTMERSTQSRETVRPNQEERNMYISSH